MGKGHTKFRKRTLLESLVHITTGEIHMGHVFISYIQENRDQVWKVCDELTQRGFNIWIDENELTPGVGWRSAIRKAILGADFFLAFFSKEFYTKDRSRMHEEIALAIEQLRLRSPNRIWFIPIRLSGKIPDRSIGATWTLRDLQYADLEHEPERDLGRIIQWLQNKPSLIIS